MRLGGVWLKEDAVGSEYADEEELEDNKLAITHY